MEHHRSLDIQSTSFCDFCPRQCAINRLNNEVGFCGKTLTPDIAHVQLHNWEEPCISCGAGSGTIFFSGCNLACVYCQNYQISETRGAPSIQPHDVSLSNVMLDLQEQNAANINLVTPTHFAHEIRTAILEARERGLALPIIWNTSSYEFPEQILLNKGLVDIYLADMKYANSELGAMYSAAADYPKVALSAIDAMVGATKPLCFDEFDGCRRLTSGVIVRHMVLPGQVEDSCKVLELIHSRFGDSVCLSIMNQYTPVLNARANEGDVLAKSTLSKYPELGRSVTVEEYETVLDFADDIGIENYCWQDGETCKESFIPAFESSPNFK